MALSIEIAGREGANQGNAVLHKQRYNLVKGEISSKLQTDYELGLVLRSLPQAIRNTTMKVWMKLLFDTIPTS